jgi:hypothetical protein
MQGPLCATCKPNGFYFAAESGTCEECQGNTRDRIVRLLQSPTTAVLLLILGFVVVWSFVAMFAFIHTALGSPPLPACLNWITPVTGYFERNKPAFKKVVSRFKMKVKALVSFSQVSVNIAFNTAVHFPSNFDQVLNGLKFANLDLVPSFACWMPRYDLINSMVFMSVIPMGLALILGITFIVVQVLHKRQKKRNRSHLQVEVSEELKGYFRPRELKVLKKTFQKFDVDNGGSINHEELKHMFSQHEQIVTDQEVQDIMNLAFKEQLEVVDVRNHQGVTGDGKHVEMAKQCSCGNIYIETSIFCRRCGLRRPPAAKCVEEIHFEDFLNLMRRSRDDIRDTPFSHLIAHVEAKVTFVRGQIFAYMFLFLTFMVFVGTSTTILQFFKCTSVRELRLEIIFDCEDSEQQPFLLYCFKCVCLPHFLV